MTVIIMVIFLYDKALKYDLRKVSLLLWSPVCRVFIFICVKKVLYFLQLLI